MSLFRDAGTLRRRTKYHHHKMLILSDNVEEKLLKEVLFHWYPSGLAAGIYWVTAASGYEISQAEDFEDSGDIASRKKVWNGYGVVLGKKSTAPYSNGTEVSRRTRQSEGTSNARIFVEDLDIGYLGPTPRQMNVQPHHFPRAWQCFLKLPAIGIWSEMVTILGTSQRPQSATVYLFSRS